MSENKMFDIVIVTVIVLSNLCVPTPSNQYMESSSTNMSTSRWGSLTTYAYCECIRVYGSVHSITSHITVFIVENNEGLFTEP